MGELHAVQPPQLVHVVVVVVTGLCKAERGKSLVDVVDVLAESGPLVQT